MGRSDLSRNSEDVDATERKASSLDNLLKTLDDERINSALKIYNAALELLEDAYNKKQGRLDSHGNYVTKIMKYKDEFRNSYSIYLEYERGKSDNNERYLRIWRDGNIFSGGADKILEIIVNDLGATVPLYVKDEWESYFFQRYATLKK